MIKTLTPVQHRAGVKSGQVADVVLAMREPVTLTRAAEITGRSRNTLREIVRDEIVKAKACLVSNRAELFELWELEAALAGRRPYKHRKDTTT